MSKAIEAKLKARLTDKLHVALPDAAFISIDGVWYRIDYFIFDEDESRIAFHNESRGDEYDYPVNLFVDEHYDSDVDFYQLTKIEV